MTKKSSPKSPFTGQVTTPNTFGAAMKALMNPAAVILAALLPSVAIAAPAPAEEPTPVTEGESTEAEDTGAETVEVKTFASDELYKKMSHFDAGRQGIRAFNAFTTEPELAKLAGSIEDNLRLVGKGKKKQAAAFDATVGNTAYSVTLLYSLTGPQAYDIEDYREWTNSKGCVDDIEVSPCSEYLNALKGDAQLRIDRVDDSPAKAHATAIMGLAENSLDPVVITVLLHTAPTLLPEESWSDIWPQPAAALAATDGPDTDEGGYTVHEALTRDKMAERQPSDGRDWPGDDPNAELNQDMAKVLEGLDGYVYTRDSDAAPQHGEISNFTEEGFEVGDQTYTYEDFNSGEKILTTEPMNKSGVDPFQGGRLGVSLEGGVILSREFDAASYLAAVGTFGWNWKHFALEARFGAFGIVSGGDAPHYTVYAPSLERWRGLAGVGVGYDAKMGEHVGVRVMGSGDVLFGGQNQPGGRAILSVGPNIYVGKKKNVLLGIDAKAGWTSLGAPVGSHEDPNNPFDGNVDPIVSGFNLGLGLRAEWGFGNGRK